MSDAHEDLLSQLRTIAAQLDEQKRERWNRSLPFPDLLGDRWARAERLGFEEHASIYDSSVVLGEVLVGEHTWVGPNTVLDGSGGPLSIGAWCTVSAGTHIYTHDTVLHSLSGGLIPRKVSPVSIADRVYVGPNCVVTAGVTIDSLSVVAANSLVRADVPSRSVVAGSPARVIGRVDGTDGEVRLVMSDADQAEAQ